tara:strand:- start:4221 stop:4433 length:213 start_codon:yes stop_codon:yes gene_type:complete
MLGNSGVQGVPALLLETVCLPGRFARLDGTPASLAYQRFELESELSAKRIEGQSNNAGFELGCSDPNGRI